MEDKQINTSAFVDDSPLLGKKIKTEPVPNKEIGIDTENKFFDAIVNQGMNGLLEMSNFEAFSQVSQNRDQLYQLLDAMCEDSTVAAALEIYAEDATEYNDKGNIVWCESDSPDISKYVTFLLDTMNVDKNIYKWVYSLCKYGDLYLRLFRESDYNNNGLFGDKELEENKKRQKLEEASIADQLNQCSDDKNSENKLLEENVKIVAYADSDHYINYIEAISNPAEIFELIQFSKTYAYIEAPSTTGASLKTNSVGSDNFWQYKFKQTDIKIHSATDYVHATLDDNSNRFPEEVTVFRNNEEDSDSTLGVYKVKRGQSLLYNTFRIWRILSLLENSVLLNRVTKSSIVRIIGVEVGPMPKEMVQTHLARIKSLIEQKTALETGKSMSEYTNPGPIENNVYVPTKNGVGAITTTQVGGDVDVKGLADLDYFKNKFYGAMRIPKQYMGDTDDSTGFNGGTSLSIISSRYAKTIKRIQNSILQALTDAINLMLIDRGLTKYVNKFTLRMQAPTTQEEIDRRENMSGKVQLVGDIMNMLTDLENNTSKLKILKSMLANTITDTEVINLLQEEIDKLEAEANLTADNPPNNPTDTSSTPNLGGGIDNSTDLGLGSTSELGGLEDNNDMDTDIVNSTTEPTNDTESEKLPSPEELDLGDMSDNDNPALQ